MHGPPRLRSRDPPLPVVHSSAHGSKIAIARRLDVTVIGHAPQEVPLDGARLPGPPQELLLLVGT